MNPTTRRMLAMLALAAMLCLLPAATRQGSAQGTAQEAGLGAAQPSAQSGARREPVLKQIALPHNYYYREMYLPQLTSGPSSVAWMPDAESLVFSMAGSLWRQALPRETTGTATDAATGTLAGAAEQLTSGPGYDYQPDVSRDGRWVIFARYANDAVELHALDLRSGEVKQLTRGGAVNLDARFSPDGKRIAFVSTQGTGRFYIFLAGFRDGALENVQRLGSDTRSDLPRYYYSAWDHEISPAWSPDGRELLFVSNRGHIYGTGGIWRAEARAGAAAAAREIQREETTWKARPDWSPDGTRVVYSSYSGRQWHQLTMLPAEGGNVLPVSYGEFDNTAARWSPDGKQIAFISNRGGNTSLWMQDAFSGEQTEVVTRERKYRVAMGRVRITVVDATGKPAPARISVTGADGRAYAPRDAWVHGDEMFSRDQRKEEARYFHSRGVAEVDVPAGKTEIEVMRGFEYGFARRTVDVAVGATKEVPVALQPLRALAPNAPALLAAGGRWVSGDLHVHMNYGGAYRATPATLRAQAEAENLGVVHNLIVNKEVRIPDVEYFSGKLDPISTARTMIFHGQEFHTSSWGHLGFLGLRRHLVIPDYVDYPQTATASLYPTNVMVAEMARRQQGLVGYVHPFDDPPDPAGAARLMYALPVSVALGAVDYFEVMGFSDHHITAAVWYRLLNLGFWLPAGAGTDAMTNFASLRGPLGLVRVYVFVPNAARRGSAKPTMNSPTKADASSGRKVGDAKEREMDAWLDGLKRGRTFVSNGPLLEFEMSVARGLERPGGEICLPSGGGEVKFEASVRSLVPLDHAEVVCNGEVVQTIPLGGNRTSADARGTVKLTRSGWCVLRAWGERPQHPILDLYPYATTSPIYIKVGNDGATPARSPADAAFFLTWMDRIIEGTRAHRGWRTDAERDAVLRELAAARAVFEKRQ